jgi:hypothetical protein
MLETIAIITAEDELRALELHQAANAYGPLKNAETVVAGYIQARTGFMQRHS